MERYLDTKITISNYEGSETECYYSLYLVNGKFRVDFVKFGKHLHIGSYDDYSTAIVVICSNITKYYSDLF